MADTNESIKRAVEEDFLKILTTSFKENLKSVMLYGSFVSGNFIRGVSDINILIILKNVEFEQIQNMGKNGFKFMKRYKITPLILSKDEFLTSAEYSLWNIWTYMHGINLFTEKMNPEH